MLRKFKKIDNFGIFNEFDWDSAVCDENGRARDFQHINIIYGRNYSGKTTLSRIARALETGEISDKFEYPSFSIELADSSLITQATLTDHNKKIRVFNEDFVRANLRFITNPDDSIEPFAILGDDNNKLEVEIETFEAELGSKEEGKETGLYFQKAAANGKYTKAFESHKKAIDDLERKLRDKAINREIGIKYKPERFGDQNYSIQKLKTDIEEVVSSSYLPSTDEQLAQHEKLISEKRLQPISPFHAPILNFQDLTNKAEALVTKKISESDKIEELVKDAVLNRWVNEGRNHHKGKRNNQFLTLEAKKEDNTGETLKRIRFEVIRDGKKAYHLSEGECSLLAFCYFLAKLDDIDTRNLKPIIWIDDPISSLDGNHIFFVYSLLKAEIVSTGKYEQLFVSTHNLDFLKYLKRLKGSFLGQHGKQKDYSKDFFVVVRNDKRATIELMPKYLKEYVTEFNYLFHQILKCSAIPININDLLHRRTVESERIDAGVFTRDQERTGCRSS